MHRPGARAVIVGGGVLLALGIAAVTAVSIGNRDDANTLSQQVLVACATGGAAGAELQALGSCPLAAAVQADVQEQPLLDTGLSASQTAEVIGLVRGEIALNPPVDGRTLDASVVLAAVRTLAVSEPDLLRGEQGEPGAPPSDEQVRAIAAAVIASDPEAFRGEPGDNGDDGVDGGVGDRGEPGLPGRGITATEQDPDDPCTRIVRYDQPPLEERWNTCPPPVVPPDPPTTPPDVTEPPPTASPPAVPDPMGPDLMGDLFR